MSCRAVAVGLLVSVVALFAAATPVSALSDEERLPPEVVETDWVDGEIVCDATSVEQSRTVTTTPYVFVEGDNGGEWVLDVDGAVSETETRTRELDDLEIITCPLPPQPPDEVSVGEWVDGEIVCDAATVEQTRTSTITPHSFNGDEWVLDLSMSSTLTQTRTRDLGSDEMIACPPSSTTPETTTSTTAPPTDGQTITTSTLFGDDEEPEPIVLSDAGPAPAPTSPASPTPTGPDLPATGGSDLVMVVLAVVLMVSGGSIMLAARRNPSA